MKFSGEYRVNLKTHLVMSRILGNITVPHNYNYCNNSVKYVVQLIAAEVKLDLLVLN